MSVPRVKLRLPTITHVGLERFSLFEGDPNAKFDCSPGVTCLMGANGVGKSTLLNAISFALTGIVPDPTKSFKSFDEYYAKCLSFPTKYFKGRIAEKDRDSVSVQVKFSCNGKKYSVKRALFDPRELLELSITDASGKELVELPIEATRPDRQIKYESELLADTGFTSFSQFAFFQHFVCTFDERRTMLLYSERIMEHILYLAFLVDTGPALKADSLKREFERFDSKVRNYQWEISKNQGRVRQLQEQAEGKEEAQTSFDELSSEHKAASESYDVAKAAYSSARKSLEDISIRLAHLTAAEAATRDDFNTQFTSVLKITSDVSLNPLVVDAIQKQSCGLCGSLGENVKQAVTSALDGHKCPLCSEPLPSPNENTDSIDALKKLDENLAEIRKALSDTTAEFRREQENLQLSSEAFSKSEATLRDFESKNLVALEALRQSVNSAQGLEPRLKQFQELVEQIYKDKSEAEKSRAEAREQLNALRESLKTQYYSLEHEFVPSFRTLAHKFLGMELDIRLDSSESDRTGLVVEVKGTARRDETTLSESQKFFMDIAFRMAILQFVSDADSPACLVLDTPEGSLDIAYEKRAGDMLSMFVDQGHSVLMSANLNSSQLLLALAEKCKASKMSICPIMDWAALSEVQIAERDLFDDARDKILQKLGLEKPVAK